MSASAPAPAASAPSIRSKGTISWILYDLANTIFSLNIVSLYFSLWVVNDMGGFDATYGNANALSMLLMFLTAPAIGALSDMGKRRMPFLIVSTLVCVGFTMLLGQGGLITSLAFFVIANYFYQAGLIFYDALLPTVSTESNRGLVSGVGVGVGYIGSFIGLGVGATMLARDMPKTAIFQATGLLFLIFAIPAFLFVKERPRKDERPLTLESIGDAFRSVRKTFERTANYPSLRRFLIGRIFYTDAANTVIAFMGIYVSQELGFTEGETTIVLAVGIAAAVVGGFIWGPIVDRFGPKRTLLYVLGLWMITLLFAIFIPVFAMPPMLFYAAAALAGVALGGTWSADRPLMIRLSPPRYLGQFYGLYSMVGRFASIIGPFLWGFVVTTLGLGRPVAIFSLFIMVVIAFFILRRVDDNVGEWPAEELVPV